MDSEKRIRYFSDELESLEKMTGSLLEEINRYFEEETALISHASMLELRANFLYQRVVKLQQEMRKLLRPEQKLTVNPEKEMERLSMDQAPLSADNDKKADRSLKKVYDLDENNPKSDADEPIKGLSLSILGQQMILVERQRINLEQLTKSLSEMRKAAGTLPATEKMILLRQLKDSLNTFGNHPSEL